MNPRIRRVVLALFGLSLAISISAALIFGGVLLLDWFLRAGLKKTKPWEPSALDIPLAVWFGWTVLTVLLRRTADIGDALSSQSALLLFYWAAHDLNEEDVMVLFRWFCGGVAFTGLVGILQHVGTINYTPDDRNYRVPEAFAQWPQPVIRFFARHGERAVGTRSHPLTYAETFILPFFLVFSAVLASFRAGTVNWRRSAWLMLAGLLIIGGVVYAEGRGVWLGLAVGCVVFAWFQGKKFFQRSLVVFALLGTALLFFGPQQLRGRLLSIVSHSSGTQSDQLSKQTRYELWREGFEQMKQRPLMGVGYKGARLPGIDPISGQPRIWTEMHNIFFQNAVELGLIGLAFFLWMLVVIARMLRNAAVPWHGIFLAAFTTFMVMGLTESWTRDKEVAMVFWLMVGCAEVFKRREEK